MSTGIDSTMLSPHRQGSKRKKVEDAGYGGVRFRDTKGEGKGGGRFGKMGQLLPRQPNWEAAGIVEEQPSRGGLSPGAQTAAEVNASRNKSGIAPTANNMGSLAVQSRADDATAREAGLQTAEDKRTQNVLKHRAGTGFGSFGGKGRNSAMAAFQKKYWEAREVWAAGKDAYTGAKPFGSEVSHSGRSGPRTPAHRTITSKRPSPRSLSGGQSVHSGFKDLGVSGPSYGLFR